MKNLNILGLVTKVVITLCLSAVLFGFSSASLAMTSREEAQSSALGTLVYNYERRANRGLVRSASNLASRLPVDSHPQEVLDLVAAAFNAAYTEGRELYQLSSAIARAGRTIEANNNEIADMRDTIRQKEQTLVSDDTPQAKRTTLLQEVRELEQEIGRLESETLELERERAVLIRDLEELEASFSRY